MAGGLQELWCYNPRLPHSEMRPKGRSEIKSAPWDIYWVETSDGWTTSGMRAVGTKSYVLIDTYPKTSCGWVFDHWELWLLRYGDADWAIATVSEKEHIVEIPAVRWDETDPRGPDWMIVDCYPIYRFEGTGKILRDAAGKVMRSNRLTDRILFDA